MRKITQIQTIDGVIHPDERAAKAHLSKLVENGIGKIVDKLQYSDRKGLTMWQILADSLPELARLNRLNEDAKGIENADNDDEF